MGIGYSRRFKFLLTKLQVKNIAFFITHKTLDLEHAELSFEGFNQQICLSSFDILYIYNSHENELSNESLLLSVEKYNLKRLFKEILIFPYDKNTHKSLGGDVNAIKQFCKLNHEPQDRILLVKSDSILSVNFFDDILNRLPPNKEVYYVAPFVCAKKRVSNKDIISYSKRIKFTRSDEITFFVEDQFQSQNNDFFTRPGTQITDNNILFTSCYVIRDFSCHFLTLSLFDTVSIQNQSWGGVNFSNLHPYFISTERSFVVHKYHDIVSENRSNDREGPVKDWLNS